MVTEVKKHLVTEVKKHIVTEVKKHVSKVKKHLEKQKTHYGRPSHEHGHRGQEIVWSTEKEIYFNMFGSQASSYNLNMKSAGSEYFCGINFKTTELWQNARQPETS